MKVDWWQAGVHIEPETDEERRALGVLVRALYTVKPIHEVTAGTLVKGTEGTDED